MAAICPDSHLSARCVCVRVCEGGKRWGVPYSDGSPPAVEMGVQADTPTHTCIHSFTPPCGTDAYVCLQEEVDAMIERRVRDFRLDTRLRTACEGDIYSMCAFFGVSGVAVMGLCDCVYACVCKCVCVCVCTCM